MTFPIKVDPLNAAITLIYKHGHQVTASSELAKTVGHERPDLKHPRLNDDAAWSTANTSMTFASVHVTKSPAERKQKVGNVVGTGAQAASKYAKKHKLAMALGLMTRFAFGFDADVYTLNWKYFDKVLADEVEALATTYRLLQTSLADEKDAKANKLDASRYRSQVIACERRMRKIKGVITLLLEERQKHEGNAYFQRFRWHESTEHGRMRQGGAQNVTVTVKVTMTAHKQDNRPTVTVDMTYNEGAPGRGARETGKLVFSDGGKTVRGSQPIGEVAMKFADITPADISKAHPAKTTAALAKRIQAMPEWRYVSNSPLKTDLDVHRGSKPRRVA